MYACITRETFVFTVFRRVFHSILKLELCRHACRRRDQIIPTCGYGKNMPTTALVADDKHKLWSIEVSHRIDTHSFIHALIAPQTYYRMIVP